jgi:hypothetical protein
MGHDDDIRTLIALRKAQGLGPDIHGEPYRKIRITPPEIQVLHTERKWNVRQPATVVERIVERVVEREAAPQPDPVTIEKTVSDPADAERIRDLEDRLVSTADELSRVQGALAEAARENAERREAEQGMEYGPPAEVVTEVEAEAIRPRLIASDWMRSQMKEGESLEKARNRLLQEYNELLNRNVTASFASDAERVRFRDLTANMNDFSKG